MEKLCNFVTILLLFLGLLLCHGGTVTTFKSQDRSEEWGYVQVKPKSHMFWWLCRSPYRVEDPSKPWPIILWLQGGPIEVNGDNSAPLYKFLKAGKWGIFGDEIQWNFTKFLVDKDGQVVGRYYPTTILWKQ